MSMLKEVCVEFWKEILFLIFVVIYLILLNRFNEELLVLFNKEQYVAILTYKNYSSIRYFLIALILCIFGVIVFVRRMKRMQFLFKETNAILMLCLSLMVLVLIFSSLIKIIICISNPILRAILAIVIILAGLSR